MISNPEFRRNLWLELTPHRLISAPVFLALVLALAASSDDSGWQTPTAFMALLVFVAVTVLWGGRQAYDAMIDELRERTWDTQRMSALSPTAMVIGKLLGSTVFNWYVGGLCLAVFCALADLTELPALADWSVARIALVAVFAALLLQAAGFLAGLIAVRSGFTASKGRSLPMTLLGLLLAGGLAGAVMEYAESAIRWHDDLWPAQEFLIVSLAVFTGWLWLGAWRLMAELLAVRLLPWGLPAFTLFLAGYLAGFVDSSDWPPLGKHLSLVIWVGIPLAYISAWKERRDWITIQRFLRSWQADSPMRALQATPEWLVVGLLTLLAALVGVTALPEEMAPAVLSSAPRELLTLSPLTLSLLLFRDVGLLYYFGLGSRPDRAGPTTLVYWFLLWVLLPLLLGDFGLLASPALATASAATRWIGALIAAGHLAVVAFLVITRLGQRQPIVQNPKHGTGL
jgi:hypothetical protein